MTKLELEKKLLELEFSKKELENENLQLKKEKDAFSEQIFKKDKDIDFWKRETKVLKDEKDTFLVKEMNNLHKQNSENEENKLQFKTLVDEKESIQKKADFFEVKLNSLADLLNEYILAFKESNKLLGVYFSNTKYIEEHLDLKVDNFNGNGDKK